MTPAPILIGEDKKGSTYPVYIAVSPLKSKNTDFSDCSVPIACVQTQSRALDVLQTSRPSSTKSRTRHNPMLNVFEFFPAPVKKNCGVALVARCNATNEQNKTDSIAQIGDSQWIKMSQHIHRRALFAGSTYCLASRITWPPYRAFRAMNFCKIGFKSRHIQDCKQEFFATRPVG